MGDGRGRARAAACTPKTAQLQRNLSNAIHMDGMSLYRVAGLNMGKQNCGDLISHVIYFQSLKLLDPRNTNMNETDMSAVLLIIISVRLKEPRRQGRCEKGQTH